MRSKEGLEGEWEDVLEIVAADVKAEGKAAQTSEPRKADPESAGDA